MKDDLIRRKDALKKDDTISRQAAIEAFGLSEKTRKYGGDHSGYDTMMLYEIQNTLESLPSAPRWIPVSERLPEDLEEVNVTWVNHAPEQYYDFVKDKHFSGSAVYYNGSWYWYSSTCVDILVEYGRNEMDKIDDGIEPVAWMPLPEPWKGEDDD